jgi:hypothetical protein
VTTAHVTTEWPEGGGRRAGVQRGQFVTGVIHMRPRRSPTLRYDSNQSTAAIQTCITAGLCALTAASARRIVTTVGAAIAAG